MRWLSLAALSWATLNPAHLYSISNPNTYSKQKYATDYGKTEFFDVYSPEISTRYSEVFWTLMDKVPLPDAIIRRFANKTMAIVGYEADQVMVEKGKPDVPVPITWAYDHHYIAYMHSTHTELEKVRASEKVIRTGMNHGAKWAYMPRLKDGEKVPKTGNPLVQVFSEGNGGEFRGSYHGYPKSYAQLLESPEAFQIYPMQVDTKNREHPGTPAEPGFVAGPLPKAAKSAPDATYSGLLECPCSTRVKKELFMAYGLATQPKCPAPTKSAEECFLAAPKLCASPKIRDASVSSQTLPSGCTLQFNADGSVDAVWNTAESSVACNPTTKPPRRVGFAASFVHVLADVHADGVQLTLTGPANVWFGVGFGAQSMCLKMEADECVGGGPYALIVHGDGVGDSAVEERKLDDHGPGVVLPPTIKVISDTVSGNERTVVVSRPLAGPDDRYFRFDPNALTVDFINALGSSHTFGYHRNRTGSQLTMLPAGVPTCVCELGIEGTLNGRHFHKNCPPPPTSDLSLTHNPTCTIETYTGGLSCCYHGKFLLDEDQEPWEELLTYHLKFRFYFEDYKPDYHHNLPRFYWQTEAFAGEYDIVQCKDGTPHDECVQVITSHWKVRDMMNACDIRTNSWCTGIGTTNSSLVDGVHLLYAGPHCHAPSCISMELYNGDTGDLLCRMGPRFGESKRVYEEKGYVAIPPCVWGDPKDGLLDPALLSLDTELISIKRNNNTNGHLGEMASWQMRGVVIWKDTDDLQLVTNGNIIPDFHV